MSKLVHALKTYNERGIFSALIALLGGTGVDEKTIQITSPESSLFHTIEKRLARTRLVRSANPTSSVAEEFSECLVGFTAALSGCHEYLSHKTKSKHFVVQLTYFGAVETSPMYSLTIRSVATGNPVLTSVISGIY
jgi:hypothetical protein